MNIANNDLRANEGRETNPLNCKPITNLKEISELSNYCKPAVFVCTLLVAAPLRACQVKNILHSVVVFEYISYSCLVNLRSSVQIV